MHKTWKRFQALPLYVFFVMAIVLGAPQVAFASNDLTWFDFFKALAIFAIGPFLMLLIIIDSTSKQKKPIGGWLRFYSWQVYFGSLVAIASLAGLVSEFCIYGWESMRPYLLLDLAPVPCQLILLAQTGLVFRMWGLEQRDRKLVYLLKLILLAGIVAGIVSVSLSSQTWSYVSFFWAAAWLLYFTFSKRVQAVFLTKEWPETERDLDAQDAGEVLKPEKVVKKSRTLILGTLMFFAGLSVIYATYLNIRMGRQYFGSGPEIYSPYAKKEYVNKRYNIYLLMKISQSQDRSIDILADALEWFKTNPDGDGNMKSGEKISGEKANLAGLPGSARQSEQLRQETITLYRDVEDVSPEASLRETMSREVNHKTISSIYFRLKEVRLRTRKILTHQLTGSRNAPRSSWPTKIDQVYIEVYEEFADTLPEQESAQYISENLLHRLMISALDKGIPGSESTGDLSKLEGKKKVHMLFKVDPTLKYDPIIKKYLALRDQRIVALRELDKHVQRIAKDASALSELDKNLPGTAKDAYIQSTIGLIDLRKDIETALFGRVMSGS